MHILPSGFVVSQILPIYIRNSIYWGTIAFPHSNYRDFNSLFQVFLSIVSCPSLTFSISVQDMPDQDIVITACILLAAKVEEYTILLNELMKFLRNNHKIEI
jgi:mannitol/fructose-specific phosphotransferase system IIA component (Ntr-type)